MNRDNQESTSIPVYDNDVLTNQINHNERMSNVWNGERVSKVSIYNIYDTEHYDDDYYFTDGFSLYIETPDMTILFDTPYNDMTYVEGEISTFANMKTLGLAPEDVDVVVLSHKHGCLVVRQFLQKTPDETVVYGLSDMHIEQTVRHNDNTYIINHKFRKLGEGIYITAPNEGVIERGSSKGDILEQALVIVTEKGLMVFVGCCHSGIDDILEDVETYFEGEKIYLIYGGLHLANHTEEAFETRTGSVLHFSDNESNDIYNTHNTRGLYNWETVEYKRSINGDGLLMDIYTPIEDYTQKPVLLYIHGGGWFESGRSQLRYGWTKWLIKDLVEAGYAVISVDYTPLDEVVNMPVPIIDVKDAVRWIHKHADNYGFDSADIGVLGYEAGGHLAMMVGYWDDKGFEGEVTIKGYPSEVKYVVNYFGPSDLETIFHDSFNEECETDANDSVLNSPWWSWELHRLTGLEYEQGSCVEMLIKLREYSPVHYITPNSIPVMMVEGEKADEGAIGQRETLSDIYMKHGIQDRLVYMKIPGASDDIFIDNDLLDDKTQEQIKELTLEFIFANTD